jgi:YD repeat-containing protein
VFGECVDPTNPDCTHLPLTLYEPPSKSGFISKWKNKAKGYVGRAKSAFNSSSVRPFSGEFQATEADLLIPGRGVNFEWVRTYRSRAGLNTAMGNDWDFSYNIFLEPYSGTLLLHDGTGRRDVYYPQSGGKWVTDGFFRELQLEVDNSFTLVFPDLSTWHFLPLDDPNAPGKIDAITDRNGNSLGFEYDAAGRLIAVVDPLDTGSNGRVVTIGYDSNDLIVEITDWAGRQVKYEYYEDGDANGSAGDLKSVTTPVVVDNNEFTIPAGHEYPEGKTTTYTYTTGLTMSSLSRQVMNTLKVKPQLIPTLPALMMKN